MPNTAKRQIACQGAEVLIAGGGGRQANCGVHSVAVNPSKTLLVTGGANPCDCAVFSLPTMETRQLMVVRSGQPASLVLSQSTSHRLCTSFLHITCLHSLSHYSHLHNESTPMVCSYTSPTELP